MTTLGMQQDLFKKFQDFRDKILNAQADISAIKAEMQPYIDKAPENGGFKLDTRKVLDNAIQIREAELYGEAPPKLDMNTQKISKEMLPSKNPVGEEVDLSKVEPAPLTGRAKEIAEEMKNDDAKNFTAPVATTPVATTDQYPSPSPTAEALNPTPEKKTRTRKEKPTEESGMEYIPVTQKSVKIFRRINLAINGISFTNNEVGYEVIAGTREEALEESKALRDAALADINELNNLMKAKPAQQSAPAPVSTPAPVVQTPTPTPVVTTDAKVANPNIQKDAAEVFGEDVAEAVGKKDPSTIKSQAGKNEYNLERLRSLFGELRGDDSITVTLQDGTQQLLGVYLTERTKKFSLSFPMAK